MSDWPAIDAAANVVMQETFGEPVVYQPVESGAAVGIAVDDHGDSPCSRARGVGRDSELRGDLGESVRLLESAGQGDWVTAWGTQYVVTTVRQPDAYGMLNLALLQRS